MKRLFLSALLCLYSPSAFALTFGMPVDCHYGRDCFIQNYVDDAASNHSDYRCRALTYPGHKGTDFRLRGFADLEHAPHVLAAADGKVLRLRNDAPDSGLDAGKEAIQGRECGNGLIIQHADGFETEYCHLKRGSITVHAGDNVTAGSIIGTVGYSGETEFPHVHFQVMRGGNVIDPFNAASPAGEASCQHPLQSLWRSDVQLPYMPTILLNSGFSAAPPPKDSLAAPLAPPTAIPADASSLIFWVSLMGLEAGDIVTLQMRTPDGSLMAESTQTIDRFKAAFFRYTGKKLHAPLPPGRYSGTLRLVRHGNDVPLENSSRFVDIR